MALVFVPSGHKLSPSEGLLRPGYGGYAWRCVLRLRCMFGLGSFQVARKRTLDLVVRRLPAQGPHSHFVPLQTARGEVVLCPVLVFHLLRSKAKGV